MKAVVPTASCNAAHLSPTSHANADNDDGDDDDDDDDDDDGDSFAMKKHLQKA